VRLELDENIGRRGVQLFQSSGHDVATVHDQGLRGAPDEVLFDVCAREGRILITLDRDFAEVLRFPPNRSAGIVILDSRPQATLETLQARLRDFLSAAEKHSPAGALWIVEAGGPHTSS